MVLNRSNPGAQFLRLMIARGHAMSAPICITALFQEGGQVRARMVRRPNSVLTFLCCMYLQPFMGCFFWEGQAKYSREWSDPGQVWVGLPTQGIHDMVR